VFDKAFCLRVRQILTRNHDMLIEWHVLSYLYQGAFHRQGGIPLRPHHERLRGSKRFAKECAVYTLSNVMQGVGALCE
jgi:hypothetical protein